MASIVGEQIDRRVQLGLGPGWETGGVWELDENSLLAPRPDGDERVLLSMMWPTDEEAAVLNGEANVVGAGEVNGWGLDHVGPLDEVVSYLARETPRLLAKRRRRWWQPYVVY